MNGEVTPTSIMPKGTDVPWRPRMQILFGLQKRSQEQVRWNNDPETIEALDTVLLEYFETGKPFVIINMGPPKSGKTMVSGEQLAFIANGFRSELTWDNRRKKIDECVTYIPYETVQMIVEQKGEVPQGHGPGNQTFEDHQVSSKQMGEEVYKALSEGKIVVVEAPFVAYRGDLGLVKDVMQHTGGFSRLTYNAKLFWPIPDPNLAIMATETRTHFETRDREEVLTEHNVRIHSDRPDVNIPGASENVLKRNFYQDLNDYLSDMQSILARLGYTSPAYDVLFSKRGQEPSSLALLTYIRETAPTILRVLGANSEDCFVGRNSVAPSKVEFYETLLRRLNFNNQR